MTRKTLSLLFALFFLLPFCPASVQAAEEATNVVYTRFVTGTTTSSGSGTKSDPYNLFVDALAKVQDGGTIYIQDKAFINGDEYGVLPFVIDKNITIAGASLTADNEWPSLSVRPSGIVLGADVTFENLTLAFASKCHDAIFANGHALNLINVASGSSSRVIDLFAGTLAPLSGHADEWEGVSLPASGPCGRIYVEANENGKSGPFGNLYGGSMNTAFSGAAEIHIKSLSTGALETIGDIYACGALEAPYGEMFDTTEADPPTASATNFPVSGDVRVVLDGKTVSLVDGTTGSDAQTSLSLKVEYLAQNTTLNQVSAIEAAGGPFMPILAEGNEASFSSISIAEGAELDLSGEENWSVGDFHGGGTLTLSQTGSLSVSGALTGQTAFQTTGGNGFYGTSGDVIDGNSYIVSTDGGHAGSFTFNPGDMQSNYTLAYTESGGIKKWTTLADGEVVYYPVMLASIGLPASYTLPEDNTGLVWNGIRFDVEYAYQPDEYTGLSSIPAQVTLNGEAMTGVEDESYGYEFFAADTSAIWKLYFSMSGELPEDDLYAPFYEYLWIYPGESGSIPPGTYEIGITIPGDYMEDGQDKNLRFTLLVEGAAPPPLPGDINGDGRLSLGDAVRAARIAAKLDTPTPAQLLADANGDGAITLLDVLAICRSIAKIQETV